MKYFVFFTIVMFFVTACNEETTSSKKTSSIYEKELSISVDSVQLYGTLLMPDSSGTYPLVIFVAGSGPTDRDGNSKLGIIAKPYKLLADTLVKTGIASFRYDKRAIGKSIVDDIKEQDLSFETYINDLVEIINKFKADNRFSEIILLGHSEGALISAVACEISTPNKFISVSGTALPADSILLQQLSNQKNIDASEVSEILTKIKQGQIVPVLDPNLASIFRPTIQPYMCSWMQYNPKEVYSKITIPVLIIHGTTDIQVPPNDAELLDKATPNSQLAIIEGMNHILKNAPADTTLNIETYKNANLPLNNELITKITNFIQE